jgi:hypothetical protein
MAEGGSGLEPTIEISASDYPQIMRILSSGGEVDDYLAGIGVESAVFTDDAGIAMMRCASERGALGGTLRFAADAASEVVDGPIPTTSSMVVPVSAAASLLGTLGTVSNEGLQLADCLNGSNPDAAASVRESFELLGLDIDRLRRAVAAAPPET